MTNSGKDNPRILEAFSPEELSGTLKAMAQIEGALQGQAILSVRGSKILVRAFHLTNVAPKDVRDHLLGEAMELLSLISDDIDLDFQITETNEKDIKGIYLCAPRRAVEDYLMALGDTRLRPVAMTDCFLSRINSLYRQGKIGEGRVAFLSFTAGKTVDLFVANKGKHELIRKIPFGTSGETEKEIVQSLRLACARSWPKHYDVIYYAGTVEDEEGLKAVLKKAFNVDIETCSVDRPEDGAGSGKDYFTVSLLKRYIFSRREKKRIGIGVNVVLALCLLVVLNLGLQLVFKKLTAEKFQKSFSMEDYQQALDLKKKLK